MSGSSAIRAPVYPVNPISTPRLLTVGPMIALVNMSAAISDAQVAFIASALQIQVDRDFGPAWDCGGNVISIARGHSVPPGIWPIYLLDHSDQADALGYHTEIAGDVPFSRCFIADDERANVMPSVTISHELLEMLGDPFVNQTVAVFPDEQHVAIYAKEMCDAVEDDQFAYLIGDIPVSDFVLPAYFDPTSPPGTKLSFGGNVHTPLGLAPGGYASVRKAGPEGLGPWSQDLAEQRSPRQVKEAPLSRSRRRWFGIAREMMKAKKIR